LVALEAQETSIETEIKAEKAKTAKTAKKAS